MCAVFLYRWLRTMVTRQSVASTIQHQRSLLAMNEICHSVIDSVSPHKLVCRNVTVKEGEGGDSAVMRVDGREYTLHQ